MRPDRWLLVVPLLGLLLRPGAAVAGSITINMTTTVSYENGALQVVLQVGNSGDEAAHSVTPSIRFRDQAERGAVKESLSPGEHLDTTLRIPAADLGVGRWPFRVVVDYTDANQYPFQALHVALLTVGNPPPARVAVPKMTVPGIASSGRVSLQVKNLAGVAREPTVTAFVPDDMEVTSPPARLELPAWGETTVRVDVVNRTALPGSRYPVFAAVEYEDEGVHHAIVAQDVVTVLSPRAFLSRWLLWGGAALVVGWLGFVAWRLRGRRRT